MKIIFKTILITVCFNSFAANAQQKVALHHNGVTSIFAGANPFADAYNASITGDTIYLPGGLLPSPATIDKGLVIIGAGFYPDSTTATQPTKIGHLNLNGNADNIHLEGIEMGNLVFNTNQKIDNAVIKRCKMTSVAYNGGTNKCENNTIQQCVITGVVNLKNATTGLITNSIIEGMIQNGINYGISNNILLYNYANPYYDYVTFYDVDASLISNNIIFRTYDGSLITYCELNTFQNNVFTVVPTLGTNTVLDNYNSIDLSTFFINQTGNVFNYSHDYHLQNPLTYLGNDGTQVGIYGGMFPYKEGAVPINPHIEYKNIAPQTDNNGDLNIQLKVNAQGN